MRFLSSMLMALFLALFSPIAAAQTFQPGLPIRDTNPQPVTLKCHNGTAWIACTSGGGGGGGDASAANQTTEIARLTSLVNGGNVAAGATDSGNPYKMGGVYNSTLPTYTTGQRGDVQLSAKGEQLVSLAYSGVQTLSLVDNVDAVAVSATINGIKAITRNSVFNGTTWDRQRGDTVGTYTVTTPTATAGNAIAPTASSAAEGSRVLKASAGNLYRISITTGAAAGYLMVFNATSAPADGAVTPAMCRVVAASSTLSISMADMPMRYTTGITAVFSTTGCFMKLVSATAFIEASVM